MHDEPPKTLNCFVTTVRPNHSLNRTHCGMRRYSRLADQAGADAFQALCLASRLAVTLLSHFQDQGGKLVNGDGTAFALDAYLGKADRSNDA